MLTHLHLINHEAIDNYEYIIDMKNIRNKLEYIILSIYKGNLWQTYASVKYGNEQLNLIIKNIAIT